MNWNKKEVYSSREPPYTLTEWKQFIDEMIEQYGEHCTVDCETSWAISVWQDQNRKD